jgi:hypothetical protein
VKNRWGAAVLADETSGFSPGGILSLLEGG